MSAHYQTMASSKVIIDGNLVDSSGLDMEYDGKDMNIEAYKNDDLYRIQLDQKDVQRLLKHPSARMALEERLMKDFARHAHRSPRKTKRHRRTARHSRRRTLRKHKRSPTHRHSATVKKSPSKSRTRAKSYRKAHSPLSRDITKTIF